MLILESLEDFVLHQGRVLLLVIPIDWAVRSLDSRRDQRDLAPSQKRPFRSLESVLKLFFSLF